MVDTAVAPAQAPPRTLVPSLVFLCTVVALLSSLGAPLIPTIASRYDVSTGSAQWSLTIALLVSAVSTPVMGRLGDGKHRRRMILVVLSIVFAGSVLAALPLGFGWLLVGRGLQGVGLSMIPLATTVARDALGTERAAPVVAVLAVTASAGVGLGYPLTGFFADQFGFHAPFWFGAAVTGAALIVAWRTVPSSSHLGHRRLDLIGAVLLGVAMVATLLSVTEGESWGWGSPRLLACLMVAAVSLTVFAGYELRSPNALVNLRLMRNRNIVTANITGLLTGLAMYMLLSMVTRFVQTPSSAGYGFGASVLVAGFVLLPFSVTSFMVGRSSVTVAERLEGWFLPAASLFIAAAMAVFLVARGQLWEAFVVMGVAGFGSGSIFSGLAGLIVRSVPPGETGSALAMHQLVRQIGFSIGSAFTGAVLTQHTPAGVLLPSNRGYEVLALAGLVLALVMAVVSRLLVKPKAVIR